MPFLVNNRTENLIKTQILLVLLFVAMHDFSQVSLATTGVCVFCATASVVALFIFKEEF